MHDSRPATVLDMGEGESEYQHRNPNASSRYIYPVLQRALKAHRPAIRTVFEIGCGTGDVGQRLVDDGFDYLGTEPSSDGIQQAALKYPGLAIESASVYEPLARRFGPRDAVVAIEVVEHLYNPNALAARAYELLRPSGLLVLSTPSHGYWKNLMLALSGKFDDHFMPLTEHGHIKFWSETTIRALLVEAGFHSVVIRHAGRFRPFSKSMVVTAIR